MELLFQKCNLSAFEEIFQMGITFLYFIQYFNCHFHFKPYSNMPIFFQFPNKFLKFLIVIKIQNSILNGLSFQLCYHCKILSLLNNLSHKSIFKDKFYQAIFFLFKIYVHFRIINFINLQNLQYLEFFFRNLKF